MTEEMFFDWILYIFAGMGGTLLLLIIGMGLVLLFEKLYRWTRGY